MGTFRQFLEHANVEPLRDGFKLIFLDSGKVEAGNYAAHVMMPGYDRSTYVVHGIAYPSKKTLKIVDLTVRDESLYPWDSHPKHRAAYKFRMEGLKNIKPLIQRGLESLLHTGEIEEDWTIQEDLFDSKSYKVGDTSTPTTNMSPEDLDAAYEKKRADDAKDIINQYKSGKNIKQLYKNKDNDPKAWFMRYGEWIELREDNTRTGCKVGLYPPAYTLSQYAPAYYAPTAADYVTYHDIERKKPTPTNPPQKLSYTVVSQGSDGKVSRWTETP